ncbi:MAG: metallophosphoesterase [Candidatus Thorarchaeota archaeon]
MYAIVVSDVHLGYDSKCNVKAFEDFISELENPTGRVLQQNETLSNLILIGDILDLWRRGNEELLNQYSDLLRKLHDLPTVTNKYWIWGNHDYETCLRPLIAKGIYNEFVLTDILHLPETSDSLPNGNRYCFIHGHQLVFGRKGYELAGATLCNAGDLSGGMMSHTWDDLTKLKAKTWNPIGNWFRKKFFEYIQKEPDDRYEDPVTGWIQKRIWNYYYEKKAIDLENEDSVRDVAANEVQLETDEILFFGHTHVKWDGMRVANTGSWYTTADNYYYCIDNSGVGSLKKW